MISFLVCCIYVLGFGASGAYVINDHPQHGVGECPHEKAFALYLVLVILLWPIYWTSRALQAPAMKLLLPPADLP